MTAEEVPRLHDITPKANGVDLSDAFNRLLAGDNSAIAQIDAEVLKITNGKTIAELSQDIREAKRGGNRQLEAKLQEKKNDIGLAVCSELVANDSTRHLVCCANAPDIRTILPSSLKGCEKEAIAYIYPDKSTRDKMLALSDQRVAVSMTQLPDTEKKKKVISQIDKTINNIIKSSDPTDAEVALFYLSKELQFLKTNEDPTSTLTQQEKDGMTMDEERRLTAFMRGMTPEERAEVNVVDILEQLRRSRKNELKSNILIDPKEFRKWFYRYISDESSRSYFNRTGSGKYRVFDQIKDKIEEVGTSIGLSPNEILSKQKEVEGHLAVLGAESAIWKCDGNLDNYLKSIPGDGEDCVWSKDLKFGNDKYPGLIGKSTANEDPNTGVGLVRRLFYDMSRKSKGLYDADKHEEASNSLRLKKGSGRQPMEGPFPWLDPEVLQEVPGGSYYDADKHEEASNSLRLKKGSGEDPMVGPFPLFAPEVLQEVPGLDSIKNFAGSISTKEELDETCRRISREILTGKRPKFLANLKNSTDWPFDREHTVSERDMPIVEEIVRVGASVFMVDDYLEWVKWLNTTKDPAAKLLVSQESNKGLVKGDYRSTSPDTLVDIWSPTIAKPGEPDKFFTKFNHPLFNMYRPVDLQRSKKVWNNQLLSIAEGAIGEGVHLRWHVVGHNQNSENVQQQYSISPLSDISIPDLEKYRDLFGLMMGKPTADDLDDISKLGDISEKVFALFGKKTSLKKNDGSSFSEKEKLDFAGYILGEIIATKIRALITNTNTSGLTELVKILSVDSYSLTSEVDGALGGIFGKDAAQTSGALREIDSRQGMNIWTENLKDAYAMALTGAKTPEEGRRLSKARGVVLRLDIFMHALFGKGSGGKRR